MPRLVWVYDLSFKDVGEKGLQFIRDAFASYAPALGRRMH